MNHAELVTRAGRWLRNSRKHVVVLEEIGSDGRECPDVIGWKHGGLCTLVECKVTRTDFLRDIKKPFRMRGGMGSMRWYATSPNLVKLSELPMSWGLIEVGLKLVRVVREPVPQNVDRNMRGETNCLISAVQRATDGWGRKVFGEISPVHGTIDPHPSIGATLKMLREAERSERTKRIRRDERIAQLEAEIARLRPVPMTDDERTLRNALAGAGI